MTLFRVGPAGGGGGIPSALKNAMNAVFNKKFGTSSVDYPPEDWPEDVNLMGPLPLGSASGAIAHFDNGANTVPIKSWGVTLPASLSGYSSVDAVQTGKNLFDKNNPNEVDGYIDTSVFKTSNTNAKTVYIPIVGGATYTVSKTAGLRFQIATAETIPSNNATLTNRQANNTASSITITASANDKYLWAWVFLDGTDSGTLADMLASVQIEVGSSATAYSAYEAPTQYTASLGRTIYGGSVDVVNGTGTDENAKTTLDYTGWTYYPVSGHNTFNKVISGALAGGAGFLTGYTWEQVAYIANQSNKCFYFYTSSSGVRISIRDDDYTSLEAWQAHIDGSELVYPKTPEDFTFTPITPTPETKLGVNNLWTDNGSDNQVAYRADIGLALGYNKYRYLKWTIKATRTTSSYVQMSEISFTDANDAAFTFPTGTTVTATATATSGTSPAYIIDGNTNTKYCGNWSSSGVSLNIDLGFGNTIDVSKYTKFNWYTANDATDRDPYTWELYGIDNAGNEILLCSRTAYTPTSDRKALADTVSINQVS